MSSASGKPPTTSRGLPASESLTPAPEGFLGVSGFLLSVLVLRSLCGRPSLKTLQRASFLPSVSHPLTSRIGTQPSPLATTLKEAAEPPVLRSLPLLARSLAACRCLLVLSEKPKQIFKPVPITFQRALQFSLDFTSS